MRESLLAVMMAGVLQGAVIRGAVMENQTGHPLSRATVVVEPVPGSPGSRMSVHTNRYGLFEFANEPPGVYLLQASRVGFVTAMYGQKRWNSSGMPLVVTETESPFLTIHLLRFAAVTGTVVDENDIGVPEIGVAAYLNTRPPQLVAQSTSDDRGMYRIGNLLPGNYTVRSGGKEVDGIAYKPTFARETDNIDQAHSVDVEIEQQRELASIRPLPGKLFTLRVSAEPQDPPKQPVTLTLVSDMGRETVKADSHTFSGLPGGDYEVFAEAPTGDPSATQGAYQRISLGRDFDLALTLRRIPELSFQFDGLPLQAVNDGTVKVLARRKDLAGAHDPQVLKLVNNRATLAVGPWQLALAPLDGYYVSGYYGPGYRRDPHTEGWNDAMVSYGGSVRFVVSGNVSSLHGMVKDAGEPVVGAPVFLEPMDLELGRRLTRTYVAVSDTHGQYRFSGLSPGNYRVLGSFEYQMPDAQTMANAGAKELQLGVRADLVHDLDLYVIR